MNSLTLTLTQTRPWTACAALPTLSVLDLEGAIRFYEVLGFQEQWRFPDPDPAAAPGGHRWTHACLKMGEVYFMLAQHDPADGPVAPQNVYLFLRGVRDYYAHLRLLLGDELAVIGNQGFGMRDFSMTDPWGHTLTFGESLRRPVPVA